MGCWWAVYPRHGSDGSLTFCGIFIHQHGWGLPSGSALPDEQANARIPMRVNAGGSLYSDLGQTRLLSRMATTNANSLHATTKLPLESKKTQRKKQVLQIAIYKLFW